MDKMSIGDICSYIAVTCAMVETRCEICCPAGEKRKSRIFFQLDATQGNLNTPFSHPFGDAVRLLLCDGLDRVAVAQPPNQNLHHF